MEQHCLAVRFCILWRGWEAKVLAWSPVWNLDGSGAQWQREKRHSYSSVSFFFPKSPLTHVCVLFNFLSVSGFLLSTSKVAAWQSSNRVTPVACWAENLIDEHVHKKSDALSVSCTECFDGFRFWACLYSVCLPSFNVSRHVLLFGSGGSSHTVHAHSV